MFTSEIARVAHEANRAYCLSIGDFSHAPWDDTPSMIQSSIESGVRALRNNPSLTPQDMHQNWIDYKQREGWVPGPVKNLTTKEHPNLVPFHALPEVEKTKDELFSAIVKVLLRAP